MKVPFTLKRDLLFAMQFFTKINVNLIAEGGFGDDGLDGDILGGDEEGGGWDVGDEDLVLPPDLVSFLEKRLITNLNFMLILDLTSFTHDHWGFRIDLTQCAFNLSLLQGT